MKPKGQIGPEAYVLSGDEGDDRLFVGYSQKSVEQQAFETLRWLYPEHHVRVLNSVPEHGLPAEYRVYDNDDLGRGSRIYKHFTLTPFVPDCFKSPDADQAYEDACGGCYTRNFGRSPCGLDCPSHPENLSS